MRIQLRPPGLKSLNGMRLSQLIIFYELNFLLIGLMPQIAATAMGALAKMIDACAEMSHGKHESSGLDISSTRREPFSMYFEESG